MKNLSSNRPILLKLSLMQLTMFKSPKLMNKQLYNNNKMTGRHFPLKKISLNHKLRKILRTLTSKKRITKSRIYNNLNM